MNRTTTVPCGEDCRAPHCICHHPDDCSCGCADDHLDDLDTDDLDDVDERCDDIGCPDCYDQPCPEGCDCAWCEPDTNERAPRIITLKANPAYL